jgi:uncharacterized repeat protein (TIGR02543 family)
MYNEDCSPTISNCTFVGNIAVNGGGIYNASSSSPALTNCTFYNNTATTNGGGIYNTSTFLLISSPVLTNCTFYNNTATTYGGGIHNESLSSSTITNCILWGDTAGTAGNEIHGSSVVTYSDVDGGTGQPWFGVGCIDTDPCFVDAASGDFHLLDDSPCIDAGTNSAQDLPPTDFEGDSRVLNFTVDMGVDEWTGFALTIVIEPEGAGSVILTPPGGYYFPGTVVTATANAAAGYTFDHWSGDLTGSNNPETITMDSDLTVTAHFNYGLSITFAPPNGGTVILDPPGGVYAPGTLVELDVEPAPGYLFGYFSGDLAGSIEPKNILMDSPKSVTVHFTLGDGSGTENDPYRIATVGQLQILSENAGYWGSNIHFVLTDDIVIPPGLIINPIGNESTPFYGNFDGAGHTISGLIQSGSSSLGLFGETGPSARLRNLGVVAAAINGSGAFLGILVGYNWGSTISDCSASGEVTGRNALGGLVGDNWEGTISNCYATGEVTGMNGLGGLVGSNSGNITNCYATGAVIGTRELGGLAGANYYGTITNCYATGAVTGNDVLGGLVGSNYSSTISNCYWDKDTTGQPGSSGGGTGKTTAEMKQEATFAGWDFTDTWLIMENQSYPYQHIPTTPIGGDLNGDGVVDFKDVAILCGNWLEGK